MRLDASKIPIKVRKKEMLLHAFTTIMSFCSSQNGWYLDAPPPGKDHQRDYETLFIRRFQPKPSFEQRPKYDIPLYWLIHRDPYVFIVPI